MDSKRIFRDQDIKIGNKYFPDTFNISIDSHGKRLIGAILTAGDEGYLPTVILLHGFPGYEDNHDLAHAMRRAGLNVVWFHYRGCFGVEGIFSFGNCIEDVKSVIDFVSRKEIIEKYRIDKENIFLVGHSMGGFLALTHCMDKRIKATVAISPYDFGLKGCKMKSSKEQLEDGVKMFKSSIEPLNADAMILIDEVIDNGEEWNLLKKAKYLAKEQLLIIAATGDIVGENSLHHIPLMKEINKYDNNVKEVFVDTDHSYSNKRIWLTKEVAEFLECCYNNDFLPIKELKYEKI